MTPRAVARAASFCGARWTDARRERNAAWLERVRTTYGSKPVVQYFETPIVADNALGKTIDGEGWRRGWSRAGR